MAESRYDAKRLVPIVRHASSRADILRQLGLPLTGGNYRFLNARLRQAGIHTEHLGAHTAASKCRALTREALAPLVATSRSVAQVLAMLDMPIEGRPHRELVRRIHELKLDTSHFRGRGWSRGETKVSHPAIALRADKITTPDAEVFTENSGAINHGNRLVRRLLAKGWPYRCAECGIDEWRGARLVLQLDHINGIANDNRLTNLRLLCPNCHSQTETYCRRTRGTVV